MSITTYTELKASIANWLNRDDLTSVIPDFIALAESEMDRKIRHWRMEIRANAAIDTRYTALPTDFLENVRFHLDVDERPLELVTPLFLQKKRNESNDSTGRPQYYALVSGSFEVYPTPDTSYSGQIYYYAKTQKLSDSVANNWILTHYPDTYLYGALLHSAPYLIDDARIAVWAGLYQNAISGINGNNDKAKYGGSGLRMQINSYS
tara:strand:+ start:184 stop:804 length:621 start_codon:yes stop_codon:yes gene_type:complete